MKTVCDITLQEGYQHALRDRPTQLTNPEAVYKAKSNQLSYPRSQYRKNSATSKVYFSCQAVTAPHLCILSKKHK